jgi:hypothetical protein
MLIDSFMPNPDAVETHSVLINASPDIVYQALWTADFGDSSVIKLLLGLRSLPGFVSRGFQPRPDHRRLTLQTLIDSGFGLLAESKGKEIVLGVTGRFWRPTGNLAPFNRPDFDLPVPRAMARAVWNFRLEDGIGGTRLFTETRVTCGDDGSRRKFRIYWFFVRPFSGLIRRIMLKSVRDAVEMGR